MISRLTSMSTHRPYPVSEPPPDSRARWPRSPSRLPARPEGPLRRRRLDDKFLTFATGPPGELARAVGPPGAFLLRRAPRRRLTFRFTLAHQIRDAVLPDVSVEPLVVAVRRTSHGGFVGLPFQV